MRRSLLLAVVLACLLTAFGTATPVAGAVHRTADATVCPAVGVDSPPAVDTGENTTATPTVDTSVASDESISGFTLGAGVVAVLVGGTYWYLRQ